VSGGSAGDRRSGGDVAAATDPATPAQRRMMFALWREAGVTDRDERLRRTSRMLGRNITTSTELSKRDAATLIDYLDLF
jgi:hypothetical protein